MTRVRSNALAMAGTFLVQAGFVFIQIKILTRLLTPAEFGLFSSVFALGALLGSLCELGFSVVLVRYGPKFEAEGRPEAVTRLLHTAVFLWAVTGALLGGLLLLTAGPLTQAIGKPGVTAALLGLGFFSVMSFSLRGFTSAAFQGRRRMTPALVIELVYMAGLTLSYIVLGERLSVAAVFWSFLGLGVVVGVGGLIAFSRSEARGAGGFHPLEGLPLLGEIRSFWGGALVTTALAIAFENADRLVLAALMPFESVAAYHLAGRLNFFTRKILFVPQQVAKPELAWKWETGAVEPLRADLRLFAKLEWTLGVLLGVMLVLGGRAVIVMASDARYLAAEPVVVAMAGALPLLCLQAPLTTFLRASGFIWISVRSETIWLATALLSGLLLLPRWGIGGFALGQMFAAALSLLYTVASLRKKGLPCPSLKFLIAHVSAGVALWAAAVAFTRWRPIASFGWAVVACVAFGIFMNVILARFRYLSAAEETRLYALLGTGRWSRAGRAILGWPRPGNQGIHG